jgi:hypothetical protein
VLNNEDGNGLDDYSSWFIEDGFNKHLYLCNPKESRQKQQNYLNFYQWLIDYHKVVKVYPDKDDVHHYANQLVAIHLAISPH